MAITNKTLTGSVVVYKSVGDNAITSMIVCNTADPDPIDETINSCLLTLHLTAGNDNPDIKNMIVNKLLIPAGETVFFSDEKMILSNNDSVVAKVSTDNLLSMTVSTLPV